ncbi:MULTISPECIES: beta-ketoacyl synthase chain length factor [Cupriavidus]|uniref:Beta-ketoacyl synthase chain length factor n=1 Tax=Cupriavidus pauculus TaxID=82633 RepID=A0A5P2H378_9BURK|nr:beta-ketoacyl synthase chain length factor [Cupriavidus pauculus]QET01799.1 beta-ketoacyl synthase chain length factor [Cupriavidus pauculus]
MTPQFAIRGWSAWAGGLDTPEAWRAWSQAPVLPPAAPQVPALAEVAPMLRRRVPPLGRVALAPVYAVDEAREVGEAGPVPAVFCSRHGDTQRLVPMLNELAAAAPLSPTAFGLSVHNAIGAIRSIDLADRTNLLALSAGRDTVETAVFECCSLLADGAAEVLLAYYEAPLAAPYAPFVDEPEALYAWCWRLALPAEGEPHYTLAPTDEAPVETASGLPHGLDVLRFVLAGDDSLTHRGENTMWKWKFHD